ncbi:MAG: leucyl/phenylalanyl-tRNA--protein transferase [Burkholderiales bacterium]|nr:leucyl/phenylalanyl-tRNA--protein transferase [Burkholderiales bacterium]
MKRDGIFFTFSKNEKFPNPLRPFLKEGLIAITKELEISRIKIAYQQGIFPWYERPGFVCWWFLSPRMVLKTQNLKIGHSLRKRLRKAAAGLYDHEPIEIRIDTSPREVLEQCAAPRKGQKGTWLIREMQEAYLQLAEEGFLHTVEVFISGQLAGGLYGLNFGRMFYGESMLTRRTDASKIALCTLVEICRKESIPWIDCQQETEHLASLGAYPVTGENFVRHLKTFCQLPAPDWTKYQGRSLNELCLEVI